MSTVDSDLTRVESEIARANPVPPASLPSVGSPAAKQIFGAALTGRSTARFRVRRGRRAAWLGIAVTAVAALTAVAVSAILPGPATSGQRRRNVPAVTDALVTLAGVAARQPAVGPPGPGQYQYTASVSREIVDTVYKKPFSVSYLDTRRIWIATNGSGRLAEVQADPRFLTPLDRTNWIADGRPRISARSAFDQHFGRHGLALGPVDEWKLPTDVARLDSLLRKRAIEGGPPGPAEDFVQVGDLLRETDAPPALRAALFKIAASIHGVRVLGRIIDRLGRTGIVVAYVEHPPAGKDRGLYGLDELIFAPKTSALLDEQTVVVNTRTHTHAVTSWTTYIATGVVDSTKTVAP